MVKPGDTVRYLNAVGGGEVVRVEGRIAYVDDDGFETPVQVSELVVVLPAGHKQEGSARKMFDQKAYDAGLSDERAADVPKEKEPLKMEAPAAVEDDFPVEETEYGDDMTVVLAFEPADIKQLSSTEIQALLVNDSNYFLDFQLLRREENAGWTVAFRGSAAPNELVTLESYTLETIAKLERIVFQALAYKKDKPFEFKPAMSVSRKLDLTKFYKVHCYRPGIYFETPVLEVPLLKESPDS